MGLMSFFKRGDAAPAAKPVADRADAVQQLRLRARRRLIGAAVLVGLGVIGFPLLFETQPRPIPVDLPIAIPNKEGAAPLTIPAAAAPASAVMAQATPPAAREIITEEAAPAPATTSKPAPEQEPKPVVVKPVEKPVERPADKPLERPVAPTPKPVPSAESARVQALLEGKAAEKKASDAAAGSGRFVVQVGAYADAKAAQEARMKVERMGLKTYTQAVDTPDGKRIRVRVGPFASHDEAAKVAAKVRGGGLSTAVLTL